MCKLDRVSVSPCTSGGEKGRCGLNATPTLTILEPPVTSLYALVTKPPTGNQPIALTETTTKISLNSFIWNKLNKSTNTEFQKYEETVLFCIYVLLWLQYLNDIKNIIMLNRNFFYNNLKLRAKCISITNIYSTQLQWN